MSLYKKHTTKSFFSYWNYSCIWQFVVRLEIKKLQYDITNETAKMSALSSGKIDKDEHLTVEDTTFWSTKSNRMSQVYRFSLTKINKSYWISKIKTTKSNWKAWKASA